MNCLREGLLTSGCCPTLLTLAVFLFIPGSVTIVAGEEQLAHEQHAMVLDEDMVYEIKNEKEAELVVRRKTKVFDPAGRKHGSVFIFESGFIDFEEFSGRVYDAAGELVYDFSKNDGERICGYSGYALYQDICTHRFVLTCSSYPFILEYEYRLKHKTLVFWPEWTPEDEIPVQQSSYVLSVPDDFAFDIKAEGGIPDAEVTQDDDRLLYRWSLENIAAVEEEDCTPEYTRKQTRLRFSPDEFNLGGQEFSGNSWQQLSAVYDKMIETSFKISGEQRDLVERLQSLSLNSREFCDSLHWYLQTRSRYVAIEVGIGGWLPSEAKETFDRGYGDCKDLSTMYIAMLRHAGFEARPVLILSKHQGATDPDFPSLGRFNHFIMLTILDGDTVWVDPTCEYCAFGDLPASVEDAWALIIDPDAGDIARSPASGPSDNLVCRKVGATLRGDRALEVRLNLRSRGNPAHQLSWGLAGLERHELESRLKSELFGLSEKVNVDSIVAASPQLGSSECSLTLYGYVNNAVHSVGPKKYVDISFLSSFCSGEQIDLTERKQCVDLLYPRIYADTLSLTLPEGYAVLDLPADTAFADSFFELSFASTTEADRLRLSCNRSVLRYYVEPAELPHFEASIAERKQFLPSHLVLAGP